MTKKVYKYSELSEDLKAYLASKGQLVQGITLYLLIGEIYIDVI